VGGSKKNFRERSERNCTPHLHNRCAAPDYTDLNERLCSLLDSASEVTTLWRFTKYAYYYIIIVGYSVH